MEKKELEEKIIAYFEDKGVELIYLFGSYASGKNTINSDVDIAVLYGSRKTDIEIYEDKRNLVDILGEEVDLINLEDANIIIKNQIVTKGINIYSKNKNMNIEYKYRIIVCYENYRDDSKVVRESVKKRGYVWKK